MTDLQLQETWDELRSEIQEIRSDIEHTRRRGKSRSTLRWLLIRRILEALVFGAFASMLVNYMITSISKPVVLMAIIVLLVFSMVGLIGNILQIASLVEIDFSAPIAQFRDQVGKFKLYNLMTLKLIFLTVPFYMAYMIIWFDLIGGVNFLDVANPSWLLWNTVFSGILLIGSILCE